MSERDRAKWDARYAGETYRMGAEEKAILRTLAAALPEAGRALDVACGEGQTAVFLARRGLDVVGVDVSAVGIAKAKRLAAAAGVAERTRWIAADLDDGLPAGADGPFVLITCVHFRPEPPLWEALAQRVAPGGLLLVETLSWLAAGPGGPSPRFLSGPAELLERLPAPLSPVFFREGRVGGRATTQLLAQRPPLTALPLG